MRHLRTAILSTFAALAFVSSGASAQTAEVPYWASLSAEEVYMRVGPSQNYQVDWVYRRKGLPVKVIRLQQGWRLIEEMDGTQGWVFNSLLSRERHAVVIGDSETAMREAPGEESPLRWNVEPGVVGLLGDCSEGWCEFDVEGRSGWVAETRLWGTGEP